MRGLSTLNGLSAAVMLVMLYFFYGQRPSFGYVSTEHSGWQGTRLVVFGDDWSDTMTYRVSPPQLSSAAARDPDRGELWTETLCREVSCQIA